jgi:hypothetical protein
MVRVCILVMCEHVTYCDRAKHPIKFGQNAPRRDSSPVIGIIHEKIPVPNIPPGRTRFEFTGTFFPAFSILAAGIRVAARSCLS